MADQPFRPTHLVPEDGVPAWAAPDPTAPVVATLEPGVEVEVIEHQGDWAHIVCANGWSGWVDERSLVPAGPAPEVPGSPAAPPVDAAGPTPKAVLDSVLEACNRNAVLGGVAAVAVSALMSSTLWSLLGAPAHLIAGLVPDHFCANGRPGTASMWRCSAQAGLMHSAGPIVLIVAGLVFRRPLLTRVRALTARLPANSRFLVGPVLATGLFTMVYADIHRDTAALSGLVGQRTFPAVVGLFTFVIARAGPQLAARGGRLLAARDRLPRWLPMLLAVAVTLLAAVQLNRQSRVTMTAEKEQKVILLGLLSSGLALLSKSGTLQGTPLGWVSSARRRISGGVSGLADEALDRLTPAVGTGRRSSEDHGPSPGGWRPTHVTPPGGLTAWDRPDAAAAPVPVDAGVEVELVQTWGDWAEIRAANGWTGWVDHRLLLPAAGTAG